MTKKELLDTLKSMSLGYSGAAAKIEQNPGSWVTDAPKECCEAFAMADSFREFSKALVAVAEEEEKTPDLEMAVVRAAIQYIQGDPDEGFARRVLQAAVETLTRRSRGV